jgi:outer membrane protein assembly factor BamB
VGPEWGYASSPVLDGNRVLLNAGRHGVAIDKANGEILWASAPGKSGYASVVLTGGRAPYGLFFGSKALYGADLGSGKRLWEYPWETRYDANAADPLVVGADVLVASSYGKGCALLRPSGREVREVWASRALQAHFSSSVLVNGCIYGISGNAGSGVLCCLDAKTGQVCWTEKLGFASLIAYGCNLLVLAESGRLLVIETDPNAFTKTADAQVLDDGSRCWTAPAAAAGHAYCRSSEGLLVCVRLGAVSIPATASQ